MEMREFKAETSAGSEGTVPAEASVGQRAEREAAGSTAQDTVAGTARGGAAPDAAAERLAAVTALFPAFAEAAAQHDAEDSFVAENVEALRGARFYSAGVPVELGGAGVPHAQMVACLRAMARACPATALTSSMHQHLLFTNVFNHRRGRGGTPLLRRVAESEAMLVSTGAGDWLASNGTLTPVEGGYRFSARKGFASGCERGQVLATSGRLGDEVLHFGVPFSTEGVSIGEDWLTLGMRGTGSQTVTLEEVFVPAEAVTLRRPAGVWHPFWGVVVTVALPLIMAAYAGVTDAAVELALESARRSLRERAGSAEEAVLAAEVGALRLAHASVDNALAALVANAAELDFEPTVERAEVALVNKTLLARSVRDVMDRAFALSRGRAFFRRNGLERLLRDSYGAGLHLLQEPAQLQASGRLALGLEPFPKPAQA